MNEKRRTNDVSNGLEDCFDDEANTTLLAGSWVPFVPEKGARGPALKKKKKAPTDTHDQAQADNRLMCPRATMATTTTTSIKSKTTTTTTVEQLPVFDDGTSRSNRCVFLWEADRVWNTRRGYGGATPPPEAPPCFSFVPSSVWSPCPPLRGKMNERWICSHSDRTNSKRTDGALDQHRAQKKRASRKGGT